MTYEIPRLIKYKDKVFALTLKMVNLVKYIESLKTDLKVIY